jgi:hypothetical protein
MLQALRLDQLSKLLEEIRDFEQVIHPSQIKSAKVESKMEMSDPEDEVELKMNSKEARGQSNGEGSNEFYFLKYWSA